MKKTVKAFCLSLCAVLLFQVFVPVFNFSAAASGTTYTTSSAMKEILKDSTLNASKIGDTVSYHDDGTDGNGTTLDFDVEFTTYYSGAPMTDPVTYGVPVIMYVVGSGAERIGTDSDVSIIQGMLDRGFIVTVVDYLDNPNAVSPAIDWSLQNVRGKVSGGTLYQGKAVPQYSSYGEHLIVPAGYDVDYNVVYWEIDKHGADGSLEKIVEIWNNDFRGTKGNVVIKWVDDEGQKKHVENAFDGTAPVWYADAAGKTVDPNGSYTKVKWTIADTVYDCVKKDGTPVDLNLYLHVVYPTNPAEEVPVYCLASSSESLCDAWSYHGRPHLTGFLFSGYAVMLYDYAYVPMARVDHYGYFDGNASNGHVTGDNGTYSLSAYNEKKSMTAALRYVRYISDADHDTYKFNNDKVGVYGNSKGGVVTFLGEPHPELQHEQRYFPGHHGETRYENGIVADDGLNIIDGGEEQPWLTYENAGGSIPSNANFVYAATGGEADQISSDHAPTYCSGTMQTNGSYWDLYTEVKAACYAHNVPCLGFAITHLGHTLASGIDRDFGIDTYNAFFTFANYYLKGDAAEVMYISPVGGSTEVSTSATVTVQFAGQFALEEVEKITVQNTLTGDLAEGEWTSAYGNTEWTFHPTKPLAGDTVYLVTVPDTLVDEVNGKTVKEGKAVAFLTDAEALTALEVVGGDGTVSSTKTAFYAFTKTASTTNDYIFRFGVTGIAANKAEIYVADYNATSPEASTLSAEPIAVVGVSGAGVYSADLTETVMAMENGETIYLAVKLVNTAGNNAVTLIDFESETKGSAVSDSRVTVVNGTVVADPTNASNKVVKAGEFNLYNNYKNAYTANGVYNYNNFIGGMCNKVMTFTSTVTEDDIVTDADVGRTFRVSIRVYDTVSRRIYFNMPYVTARAYDVIDTMRPNAIGMTKAGEWVTFEWTFTYYQPSITEQPLIKLPINLYIDSTGNEQSSVYFDDYTVTEWNTTATVSYAGMATHPTVESGIVPTEQITVYSDGTTSSGDTSNVGVTESYKTNGVSKAYFKYSLDSVTDDKPSVAVFSVSGGNHGTLYVWGLPFDTEWSADSINYLNAPANDRSGAGLLASEVWGGKPLCTFVYDGSSPTFEADISEFAAAAKAAGKTEVTIALTSDFAGAKTLSFNDFDETGMPFRLGQGGGSQGHLMFVTDADDYEGKPNGRTFSFTQQAKYYERMKIDILNTTNGVNNEAGSYLTDADIGRVIRVSFKAKLPDLATAADLCVGLIYGYGGSGYGSATGSVYDQTYKLVPGEWVDIEYTFTITGDIVSLRQHHLNIQTSGVMSFPMTIYFDNLRVEEVSVGSVSVTPYVGETVHTCNLDSTKWLTRCKTTNGQKGHEVGSGYHYFREDVTWDVYAYKPSDGAEGKDHTTGLGRAYIMTLDHTTAHYGIFNVFPSNLTEDDIGKRYIMSFWMYSDDEIKITYGLNCSDRAGAYHWTYYGGTNKGTIKAGEWTKFTFAFTVDDTMVADSADDYTNPALLGIGLDMSSGDWPADCIFGTESTDRTPRMYLDDISLILTYDPSVEEAPEDPTPAIFRVVGYDDGTVIKHTWPNNCSITLNGTTYSYKMTGSEYSPSYTFTVSSADQTTFKINTDKEYVKTGTGSLTMKFHQAKNPRFKLFNTFGRELTADDVGRTFEISFYAKTSGDKDFLFRYGFMQGSNSSITLTDKNGVTAYLTGSGTMYDPATDTTVDRLKYANNGKAGADEWVLNTYTFTVTEAMIRELSTVTLTDDGGNKVAIDTSYSFFSFVGPLWQEYYGEDSDMIWNASLYIDDFQVKEIRPIKTNSLGLLASAEVSGTYSKSEVTAVGQLLQTSATGTTLRAVFPEADTVTDRRYALKFSVEDASGDTLKIYGIPGNTSATADLSKVYAPETPLAEITLDRDGEYTVDVTEFALSQAGKTVFFLFTSDTVAEKEYYALDFVSIPVTKDVDYTVTSGTATVKDGKMTLNGDVTFKNLFGANGILSAAGEYLASVKVKATAAAIVTLTAGTATANDTLAAGEEKILTLSFGAGVGTLKVSATAGIEIASVRVTSADAAFSVETAKTELVAIDAERSYTVNETLGAKQLFDYLAKRDDIVGAPVSVSLEGNVEKGKYTLPEGFKMTLDFTEATLPEGTAFAVADGEDVTVVGADALKYLTSADGTVGVNEDGKLGVYTIPAFFGKLSVEDTITFTVKAPDGSEIAFANGESSIDFEVAATDAYRTIFVTFKKTVEGEEITFLRRYSPLGYLNALLAAPSVSAEEKALAGKFKNYVYYAALVADTTGTLADKFEAAGFAPSAFGTIPDGSFTAATEHIKGASLNLNAKPEINFYVEAATGTVTVAYNALTAEKTETFDLSECPTEDVGGTLYRVVTVSVKAFNMNTDFTVTYGEEEIVYNLGDYIKGIGAGNDANFAKALYEYAAVAHAYVAANAK